MISSQEVRIEDYIRAYQATGRPPPPCPQEPSDETQRKLLNLPPLFKPHTPSSTSASDPPMDGAGVNLGILNPSELPHAQEFRLYSNAGEKYHCISTMPEFTNFCQEVRVFACFPVLGTRHKRVFLLQELRYYAYLSGNKQSPIPITMDPFVQTPGKQAATPPVAPAEESLQCIVAQPAYEKHSPEVCSQPFCAGLYISTNAAPLQPLQELRIAYLLYRRELTSAELIQLQNPSPSIPSTATIAPPPLATPIVPSTPSIPKPIFASATPSLPKFTFGFK